jgi:hypothetical protein
MKRILTTKAYVVLLGVPSHSPAVPILWTACRRYAAGFPLLSLRESGLQFPTALAG